MQSTPCIIFKGNEKTDKNHHSGCLEMSDENIDQSD